MKELGQLILSDMERVEWFHAVGRDMADLPKAIVLTNWQEAIRSEYSPEWEHILNVTSENFWIEVGALSSTRADEWNGLVDEIAPIALELVQRKVTHLELNDELRHKVIKSAKWDLQNTLMEAEYVEIHPPGFYMTYIKHLPQGSLPVWLDRRSSRRNSCQILKRSTRPRRRGIRVAHLFQME